MTQLVSRIPDKLAIDIDRLVASGRFTSRSDVVRAALTSFVEQHARAGIAAMIVEGYRLHPQNDEESSWTDEATVAMIADEPW